MTIKDQIKSTILTLPSLDDSTLIHYYKCSLSRGKEYIPLIRAIEAERKSRNKSIKEIDDDSSSITSGTSETGTN